MRTAAFVLTALVVLPVAASEPGEPLDCNDWVFLVPGLTCDYQSGWKCQDEMPESQCIVSKSFRAIDNEGFFLYVREVLTGTQCNAGGTSFQMTRLEIVRQRGTTSEVLGYLSDRCNAPSNMDNVDVFDGDTWAPWYDMTPILFDSTNGALWITAEIWCEAWPGACPYPQNCPYVDCVAPLRAFRIGGFTSLYEVHQSFTPSLSSIAFRRPYMPEGMNGADYFDTYWGDLATVGDWSQAQGLECGYPSTAPSVGDYLEVADTLPPPGPNQGYYYVTAAHYQGETRYGRKTTNGRLNGRDPAVLPECSAE